MSLPLDGLNQLLTSGAPPEPDDLTRFHELSLRLSATLDLQQVLDEVLGAVTALQATALGTVHVYDAERGDLAVVASTGLSDEYLGVVGRVPVAAGMGACGTAAAERRPVIVEDVDADPCFAPYRAAARLAGYRAVYSVPLLARGGTLLGVLATYFAEPHQPTAREQRLVELYAAQAAQAIENAQLRQQITREIEARAQSEAQLRESEARLRLFIEQLPAIIGTTDRELRVTSLRGAGLAAVGLRADEIVGQTLLEFFQTDDSGFPLIAAARQACLGSSTVCEFEWAGRWFQAHLEPLRGDAGVSVGAMGVALDITDRKRAEEENQRATVFLDSIVENIPDIVFVKDAKTLRFVLLNRACEEVLGIHRPDLLGKTDYDFYPVEEADFFTRKDREVLAARRLLDIPEEPAHTRDRGERLFHTKKIPLLGPDGQPQYLLGISADITERKRAEETLREQEAHLRLITDTLPALVGYIDADHRYRFNNRMYEEWHGHPPSELFGKHVRDVLGDEAYGAILPYIERALAGEFVTYEEETWFQHAGMRYFRATYAPDVDAAGTVRGFVVLVYDLTERRRSEEALRESETRLRLAQQAGGIETWDLDVATNAVQYSPDFLKLIGLPSDAPPPTGEDWRARIIHPDDQARVDQEVWAAVAGTRPFVTELRVTWPNGEVHWLAVRAQLIRNAAGAPVRLSGVTFDVTERKRAEERLREAQRMESVGRLAGGVAHEVNNQMTVVLGCASALLAMDDLPAMMRTELEDIRNAAERSAVVTSQLLAFSRRQLLRPETLDLNAVVQRLEPVVRRTMGADVAVSIALAPSGGLVMADRGQLEQILLNLALNARDAMPQGGTLSIDIATVVVTEEHSTQRGWTDVAPGRYAQLAVTDTGHGMDEETSHRVFEPFFTTKAIGQGTGLGLAVAYGIVTQSGGSIVVESEPGRGTTFRILLPLADAAVPRALPPSATPSAPASRGETVLVVDDEPLVRRLMSRTLLAGGYRVLEAADGREALDLLQRSEGAVDLVITDLVMGTLGGRELARALERISPGMPILFTSGYPADEIARRELLEPGRPYLPKPFAPSALALMVHQLLHARG